MAKLKSSQMSKSENFESVARELGCDPDDPRVAQVLKSMAAQPPKPHDKPSANKPASSNKKRHAAKDS